MPSRCSTSGVERRVDLPFFSNRKWRFVERVGWWDTYQDAAAVLVGHYWQERQANKPLGTTYKLAAMRWPERELVFDTGERLLTTGFGG